MNIVLAQLKKDIQCQRRPLILWGICLGTGLIPLMFLNVFTHFHAPDISNAKVMMGILSLGGLALACVLAAGFGLFLLVPVLVIRIVHEDVLMGTTAFWLTRPIPRKKLLAAKALLIAVLPLPLVLLGGTDARFGTSHFWTAEFAWVAAFAAISSITSGVREFLTYGLALLFGKAVFAGILDKVWSRFHGSSSVFSNGAPHPFSVVAQVLHLNAPDFFHLCYFAGFSVVFIHQYLTLQTRRSLAILIAIIVVASLLHVLVGPLTETPAVP
jgi:hypothetical protein